MESRLKTVIGSILNLRPQDIGEDTSPVNVKNWDSLKQMQIMLAVEEEFGIQFTDDQIYQLLGYRKIRDALSVLVSK
jgi:acyl carrier protein